MRSTMQIRLAVPSALCWLGMSFALGSASGQEHPNRTNDLRTLRRVLPRPHP